MSTPRVLILRAPGTNCDQETAFAFEQAGGISHSIHVNQLLENPRLAGEFQILCIPGGFSYGDDIAAGRILGNQFQHHLTDSLAEFKNQGKLILGICNGFQVLLKSGVLLESVAAEPPATLTWNDSGKFEDRWVYLRSPGDHCVFLAGADNLYLPIAHAEGKFVTRDEPTLARLADANQCVLRYANAPESSDDQIDYPANPNGSVGNVAGICDPSGRVFGLMPHPERHLDKTNHPRWTRGEEGGSGRCIFDNAVAYFR